MADRDRRSQVDFGCHVSLLLRTDGEFGHHPGFVVKLKSLPFSPVKSGSFRIGRSPCPSPRTQGEGTTLRRLANLLEFSRMAAAALPLPALRGEGGGEGQATTKPL